MAKNINATTAKVNSVTYEIHVGTEIYFVCYIFQFQTWYIRWQEKIIYSFLETGNKAFKGPDQNRAGYVLTQFLNLENSQKNG